MEALQNVERQLPTTIEDLSKFVLIGREKLNAVRAEIRAIEKVQLAAEVHEQKLQEAQEIAEAVLDAETKLGELTSKMEKAANQYARPTDGKSKKEQLQELGINHHERFETLAKHPETVEQAKADARAEGRIVTRQDVLNRIVVPKENKNPSIKELVETAKQEHEDFLQAKQECVVSMADVQKDKRNQILINDDTGIKIRKAIQVIGSLILVSDNQIKEMSASMDAAERKELKGSIDTAIRRLTHIVNQIGG